MDVVLVYPQERFYENKKLQFYFMAWNNHFKYLLLFTTFRCYGEWQSITGERKPTIHQDKNSIMIPSAPSKIITEEDKYLSPLATDIKKLAYGAS